MVKDIKKYFKEKKTECYSRENLIIGLIFFTIAALLFFGAFSGIDSNRQSYQNTGFNLTYKDANHISNELANIVPITPLIAAFLMIGSFFFSRRRWIEHNSGIDYDLPIYSVGNTQSTEGSFVLGCGSIDTYECYVYYKEGEFGLIKDRIYSEDVQIIMDDSIKPAYKKIWVDNELKEFLFVPKNTIKKKMNLNL